MLKVIDVLFPIIVIVGVLVAMFGLYSILTSSDSWKLKDGVSMMVYGAIAIIIMYSAKYFELGNFSDLFKTGSGEAMTTIDWITVLYDKIWFPFIKIAVYLSLGFLVILMMTRVFAYITAQDDGTKKKSNRSHYLDNGWNAFHHCCETDCRSSIWETRCCFKRMNLKSFSNLNPNFKSKRNSNFLYDNELGFRTCCFCPSTSYFSSDV